MLRVEELSVVYQGRGEETRAVDRVSFAIEPSQIVALVGESGSGKTSIGLALTRLPPTSNEIVTGRILFEGRNLLEASEQALHGIRGRAIAYVFQDPGTSLNPVLTIGEQILETILMHTELRGEEAKRSVVEWLKRVGIESAQERFSAYPHELSGGMQQRVMLAMAMAANPSLLIADEPTTALDVTIQVQILRLLRELQQAFHLSILLISHDLLVVERVAHQVGVMLRGRLVEWGAAEQVLHQPTHPCTKALLQDRLAISLKQGAKTHPSND